MISIITITYQNLAGLTKTAQSILSQTSQEYEWIIIDGNSKDGTKDFLKTLPANYISEKDNGIYDAMNKGIDRAGEEYIIFMNAGDQFASDETIEILNNAIITENFPDFIYGASLEGEDYQNAQLKSARPIKFLPLGLPTHHQAMMYKTSLLTDLRYNTSYKIAADYDFTCRFISRVKTHHLTQSPLCLFEPGGISQTSVIAGRKEQFRIRKSLKICSFPMNYLIYIMQSCSMALRQNFPDIYWYLRAK